MLLLFIASFFCCASMYPAVIIQSDNHQITYYFDAPKDTEQFPILIIAQGSEFGSVYKKYAYYTSYITDILHWGVLTVEKPGVYGPDDLNRDEYLKLNTVDQRVLDYCSALAELKKTESRWNSSVLLLGGSEGADTMARLAPHVKNIKAITLLCGAGAWTMDCEIIRLFEPSLSQGWQMMPQILMYLYVRCMFPIVKKIPTTKYTFLGDYSFQWWHSLTRISPFESLAQVHVPLYFAHGTNDHSSSVESVDECVAKLRDLGKDVTYCRYDGYEHDFSDIDGQSHKDKVIFSAIDWLSNFVIEV